jgi:hypothetical protein
MDSSHGPSVTDHNADRQRVPNESYWGARIRKLDEQKPDAEIFSAVSTSVLTNEPHTAKRRRLGDDSLPTSCSSSSATTATSAIFRGISVFFDGRIDGDLSAHALGKLIRHHGGNSRYFPFFDFHIQSSTIEYIWSAQPNIIAKARCYAHCVSESERLQD